MRPFDDPAKFDDETRLTRTCRVRDQIESRLRSWLIAQGVTPREFRV